MRTRLDPFTTCEECVLAVSKVVYSLLHDGYVSDTLKLPGDGPSCQQCYDDGECKTCTMMYNGEDQ